jgi:hypothetical protein
MYKLLLRYQQILVNGLILGALTVDIFATNSGLKDVFLGIGFGLLLSVLERRWEMSSPRKVPFARRQPEN